MGWPYKTRRIIAFVSILEAQAIKSNYTKLWLAVITQALKDKGLKAVKPLFMYGNLKTNYYRRKRLIRESKEYLESNMCCDDMARIGINPEWFKKLLGDYNGAYN